MDELGNYISIISGFAFKSSQFSETEGTPLIRIRDVTRGHTETRYVGEYESRFVVEDGDLLVSMDGEFRIIEWKGGRALLNQRVCKLIPDPKKMDRRYLLHFLPRQLKSIEDKTPFVTVKHLSATNIREIKLNLPSLIEQRRIATILDKADAIRRKRRQAIKSLEDLTQSAFVDLVGEGHPDHADWSEYTIECLAADEKGSLRTGPFGSALRHSEFVDAGIAVLGIDNAVKNYFRWDERRYITPQKYEEMKRYTVKPNDVIITIMGTTGRSAVVPSDIPLAISTKHLATITCNRDLVEPEFLSNSLHRDEFVLGQLQGSNRGAIMDGLNLGIIKSTKLKVPPLHQQQKFKRVLERIRAVQSLLDVSETSICELVNSLSARSFSGARE